MLGDSELQSMGAACLFKSGVCIEMPCTPSVPHPRPARQPEAADERPGPA